MFLMISLPKLASLSYFLLTSDLEIYSFFNPDHEATTKSVVRTTNKFTFAAIDIHLHWYNGCLRKAL